MIIVLLDGGPMAVRVMLLSWMTTFLLLPTCLSATPPYFPNLGVFFGGSSEAFNFTDFEIFNYTQTLDHFTFRPRSGLTFQQRYAVNSRYWGGANSSSPIFVHTGGEAPLFAGISTTGFFTDNAPHFRALLVYIEHRYYGESVPFGSREEAYRNSTTLGYFNSAQALADYVELITYLKRTLSAENCPVIAAGGSYAGLLAAWLRLKYPHIVYGALASSAPILYFDDTTPIDGYYLIATNDYRQISENCFGVIKQSWSEIDRIATLPNGLNILSTKFMTCSVLGKAVELKAYLKQIYTISAQYDYPPHYPVQQICSAIDGAPQDSDILGKIFAAVVAIKGKRPCYDVFESYFPPSVLDGWTWQACSEMVFPLYCDAKKTMFEESHIDLQGFSEFCRKAFGATPRPHWIATEFGGHGMKSVLQKFGSNIIFSNGLRDPYSSGGVLQNISDSIVAVYTEQGAHCLDLFPSSPDAPEWLISQRMAEVKIIEGWLQHYYAMD
ncbi:hypothetical protein H6P81_014902 [Aristolochia fimbriata]|uniref:Lysosomal Pro-X carboxypeptidase n=1 Tax=Aristolochia fimbriata TaxID=158543 RepID=A0AAV7E7U2_ARIFI|nr:hypothetical protein H6P81_014902 [Aristolochia fimbriata]